MSCISILILSVKMKNKSFPRNVSFHCAVRFSHIAAFCAMFCVAIKSLILTDSLHYAAVTAVMIARSYISSCFGLLLTRATSCVYEIRDKDTFILLLYVSKLFVNLFRDTFNLS